MQPVLNEEQTLLRESAVRLLASVGGPARARSVRLAGSGFDAEGWKAMDAAGWRSIVVPEAQGGAGLGLLELGLLLDETGRQLSLTPLLQANAATWALAGCDSAGGSAERLETEGRVVVPALVDEASGDSFGGQLPVAAETPGGWRLDGAVRFVPYAQAADAMLVAARSTSGEPLLVELPARAAGLRIAATNAVDGSGSGDLALDRVEVGPALARGDVAGQLVDRLQAMLALGSAAELVGLAQAALEMALAHLRLRQQFGKPLGSFQALQHRAVDRHVDIELNRSLVYRSVAAWDAGDDHPAMASALKARASRSALETTRFALQMHGAIGYTEEHDIGLYYKRAIVLAAQYGHENHHATRFSRLTLPVPEVGA